MSDTKIKIEEFYPKIQKLREEIAKKVIGQNILVRDILISLFAGGHILIE